MYQQQALWDNRQYPRVYRAFTGIWQTTHLWVTLDRANMKPPVRADHAERQHGGLIHWDLDSSQDPIPFGVPGVLYLTAAAADQGGFQCVPGFPAALPSGSHPAGRSRSALPRSHRSRGTVDSRAAQETC